MLKKASYSGNFAKIFLIKVQGYTYYNGQYSNNYLLSIGALP